MLRRAATAVALATVTTITAIVPAAPAQARACTIDHYCYTTFYADNSYTVVVGQKFEDCNGAMSMWGVRSPHPIFTETPC